MKEYKEGVASFNLQHRYLVSIRLLASSSADGLSLPEVTVQKGDFRFTQGPDEDVMYIFTALRVDKDLEQYLKNGWLPQYFIPKMSLISAIGQKAAYSIVQDKKDRNRYGGGLLVYVTRSDLECPNIECMCYELSLNKRKWTILGLYKPPSTKDSTFIEDISVSLIKLFLKYDHVIALGDLNFDLGKDEKCRPLNPVQSM
ncbi:hypothetical protein ACF0H5_017928 [Mactra antiquata]